MVIFQRVRPSLLALMAVLACSACANQTGQAKLADTAAPLQQMASVSWSDDMTARSTSRPSNSFLIMMR